MKYIFPVVLLVTIFFGVASGVRAHGSGISFEKQVGEYLVDIGYSSPAPEVGESVTFDFALTSNGTSVEFSNVWVKIEPTEGTLVFAGGLYNAEFGGPRMNYSFQEAGLYTISVTYNDASGAVTTVDFPLTVVESKASQTIPPTATHVIALLMGIALGSVATFFLPSLRKLVVSK